MNMFILVWHVVQALERVVAVDENDYGLGWGLHPRC